MSAATVTEDREEAITSCRICAGMCSLRLTKDSAGRIVSARGDKANPLTRGYACIKGLQLPAAHASPDRLLHPLKRLPDGRFVRVPLDEALDEIAECLRGLIDAHGPDAVAGFRGTMNYSNQTANTMLPAWLAALGSNSFFSTMTIDQSAKWVTFERLGGWAAGRDPFLSADVLMFVGTNPLVSLSTFNFPSQHPVQQMRDAIERGTRFIVIDPRRTETARHADVFLQPWPGEDAALLAGLLRIILDEGWHDAPFCAAHVHGLDDLRAALAPFDAQAVAQRTGVSAQALHEAAAAFAQPENGRRKRGSAASGTGANMGPHSNLVEHLVECLNVVCGRYARAGDPVPNPGVLAPPYPRHAQVIAPARSWEQGWTSRVGGWGMLFGQKMSGVLADEIATPGAGQVRALFVDGGNPAASMPDQQRFVESLRELDLLVTIDPFMTATARLSHFVIPPTMMFEHADLGTRDYESYVLHVPYAQYAQKVAEPPAGAEVVDDWFVFWALAQRLGQTVMFDGVALDMHKAPTQEELLAILARHASVPYDEIRAHPQGKVFDVPPVTVQPGDPASGARFQVAPHDVLSELGAVAREPAIQGEIRQRGFTHLLAVRRVRDVQNTMYRQLDAVRKRLPHNPAWLHPQDLAALGMSSGGRIAIESAHGRIEAITESDDTLRPGVIAISHGWGGLPDDAADADDPHCAGVNVNRLTTTRGDLQSINAMPRLTALPVRLTPIWERERP
ncbi:MAG TPA: molybdopterin-dependent oxidoreductase [Ramlibacter sp.]|nr:molybdopterin-dependent oxidoreductase [Ramlibacter sp.]